MKHYNHQKGNHHKEWRSHRRLRISPHQNWLYPPRHQDFHPLVRPEKASLQIGPISYCRCTIVLHLWHPRTIEE